MELVINGLIQEKEYGENYDALFVGDSESPLAKELEEIAEKFVTVRYFISDLEKTITELEKSLIMNLSGLCDVFYTDRYSEITGYLWTDESLKIGGHDLLDEISSYVGKYLYLEIKIES